MSEVIHYQRTNLVQAGASATDLVAAWLVGYKGNTREAYARDLRDWTTWCAGIGLELVAATRAHVELYARDMAENRGLADGTVARRLAAMASFYGYLLDEELIVRSPMTRVRRPRLARDSMTQAPDRDELGRLLEVARLSGPRDHALLCLLGLNGLRISEAVGIDVDDLSTDRGHRLVRIVGKGAKPALVPLAPRTAAAIDRLLAVYVDPQENAHRPLFRGRDGGRMTRHAAYAVVKKLARQAGIRKRLSPHSLRHGFARISLEAGVPIRDVQQSLRHASISTTQRYLDAMLALEKNATYRVAQLLEP
jgi:integrase/recombinase XerD